MESMVSKMGKSGMMGGGNAKQRAQIQQMQKNPQAMMKQLQNNPQAMQMVREFLYSKYLPDDRPRSHLDPTQMQQMMGGAQPGGMPGMGGGGQPDMAQMVRQGLADAINRYPALPSHDISIVNFIRCK